MAVRSHHKSHAGEYAALKARAQAAGYSSVRAFKAARVSQARAGSTALYAPRAQKSVANRQAVIDALVTLNIARGAKATREELYEAAKRHVPTGKRAKIVLRAAEAHNRGTDIHLPGGYGGAQQWGDGADRNYIATPDVESDEDFDEWYDGESESWFDDDAWYDEYDISVLLYYHD